MNLPYTLQNRPTGSTDPKYKADADEVMANLEYIFDNIAFCKLEVDVSLTSEEKNCDTQNAEYGASATNQCNLTHILGESYGGIFLGKLTGGVAFGDRLGIMDSTGRFWMVVLGHDNQISFGDGTGGSLGKCLWERIDTGSAYTGYNDTTWMNTLTIWHLSRNTIYSNISHRVLKSQLIFDKTATEGIDAQDIPLIDTGGYFTTDNIEAALAEFGAHKGDSTDPHGSTLTQTNLTVTGTTSLAGLGMTGNFAIATDKFTVNATNGNTVVGGTLTVTGVTTFNNNVVISGTYDLDVGGDVEITGDLIVHGSITQSGGIFHNYVTVAKTGGEYYTIQAAINSITDAALDNEYIILIYPGIYQEIITLKAYVYLIGLGGTDSINVPLITYPGSTVISANEVGRSSIKNLSIITSGTNDAVYADVGAGREMIIDSCYIQGAVECASGEVFMRYSRIYAIGGLNANGGDIHALWSDVRWIKTAGTSIVNLFCCRAEATTPSGTEAVYLNSTGISKFENCRIYSTSSNTHGVNINASAQHIFIGCTIKATGSGYSFYSAAAQTVIASGCVVNADKHANVTVTPGTVWQTTNTLNASI